MSDSAIELNGLYHDYDARRALDGIDLRIEPGEIFGLLGPNGGGKTTLFQILSTLRRPSGGRIRILGLNPLKDSTRLRSRIGVVFQNPSVDLKLTVSENLRCQGHLYGLRGSRLSRRIEEVLGLVQLQERRNERVELLSGGLRRRVELAKGMLHRPRLLIFDEPSTGLDPAARRAFWADLETLRTREGVTILLTTHFLEEAGRCDRVGILDRGKLVAMGSPEELIDGLGKDVIVVETDCPGRLSKNITERFGQPCVQVENFLRIESGEGHALMAEIYASFREQISSITVGRPTLEDVFVHETGRAFRSGGS